MKYTVGSTVTQSHPDVMQKHQIKVNPNLIMVPLSPITNTSAQLHENTLKMMRLFVERLGCTDNSKNLVNRHKIILYLFK